MESKFGGGGGGGLKNLTAILLRLAGEALMEFNSVIRVRPLQINFLFLIPPLLFRAPVRPVPEVVVY